MLDRRKIVELWRSGMPGSLVTLVRVEGSSYRQPGARLIVVSDPPVYAGTISGGCLEADIVRKSHWRTRNGAVIERYAMEFDDTSEIPFGLGCGGTVDVLFEALQTPEAEALLRALEQSLKGVAARVVTFSAAGWPTAAARGFCRRRGAVCQHAIERRGSAACAAFC